MYNKTLKKKNAIQIHNNIVQNAIKRGRKYLSLKLKNIPTQFKCFVKDGFVLNKPKKCALLHRYSLLLSLSSVFGMFTETMVAVQ